MPTTDTNILTRQPQIDGSKVTVLPTPPEDWQHTAACDMLTGFVGYATAVVEYANGISRIGLQGTDEKGMPRGFMFDIEQVGWAVGQKAPGVLGPIANIGERSLREAGRDSSSAASSLQR